MDNLELNTNYSIDDLFHSMENFTQKEGLLGKPLIQGDKTLIPVISMTVGYGSGTMPKKNVGSANDAQGLGAKLCTDGIIVMDNNNNVTLLTMSGAGASKLVDKIPQMVQNFTQKSGSNQ